LRDFPVGIVIAEAFPPMELQCKGVLNYVE